MNNLSELYSAERCINCGDRLVHKYKISINIGQCQQCNTYQVNYETTSNNGEWIEDIIKTVHIYKYSNQYYGYRATITEDSTIFTEIEYINGNEYSGQSITCNCFMFIDNYNFEQQFEKAKKLQVFK